MKDDLVFGRLSECFSMFLEGPGGSGGGFRRFFVMGRRRGVSGISQIADFPQNLCYQND